MKRATKILTIATLVAAPVAPAFAGGGPLEHRDAPKVPAHWRTGPDVAETAVVLNNHPVMVTENAVTPISWEDYGRFLGETAPLVGPDGRPGCGNVYTKSPEPPKCEVARKKAFEARQQPAKKGA